ncbi:MAG: DnaB-like helicase N-terminal domain-containing protein, partial [Planctomycetota bacterium]
MERTQKSLSRLPPHSEDAEKSLLGAILLDGDVLCAVALLVSPDDFYATVHKQVYEACLSLYERGSRVDHVLIKEELRRLGTLDAVGGEEYLATLAALVPSSAGAQDYARVVSEKAVARNLIHVCTNLQAAAYEGSVPGDELLDSAEGQ